MGDRKSMPEATLIPGKGISGLLERPDIYPEMQICFHEMQICFHLAATDCRAWASGFLGSQNVDFIGLLVGPEALQSVAVKNGRGPDNLT
jgi:hypothetical protein